MASTKVLLSSSGKLVNLVGGGGVQRLRERDFLGWFLIEMEPI